MNIFLIESFFCLANGAISNIAIILLPLCRPFPFFLNMSLHQWNTSFECKQLAKLATSLALYQANTGVSQTGEEMMLESLSSSGASSLSSSSSSSSASDMDLDQALDIDPVLLKLIFMTTTLNKKINSTILDGGISSGSILDLSESDAVKNCHLHKVDLQTLTEKLWPLMSVHLSGN